jgi:hypothetical protein
MPIEFGASDWKLLLDFRDDKVVRVRLLTADGPPPENGPPDKEKSNTYQAHSLDGAERVGLHFGHHRRAASDARR